MSTLLPPKPARLTLAPGDEKRVDGPATFIRVDSATGPIQIGFDSGPYVDANTGKWWQVAQVGDVFQSVLVRNPRASAVSVVLLMLNGAVAGYDSLKVVSGQVGSLALDGVDGTGILPPAGAVGIRGWLSGIYNALAGGTINIVATGFSTEVTLAAAKAVLDAIKARADLLATEATLSAVNTKLAGTIAVSGPITDTQFRASTIPAQLVDIPDVAVASGAATQLRPGDATRKRIVICNPSPDYPLRVGTNNVGAARGAIVPPNGSIELETSAAVYAYQTSGGAINVPVLYTLL